MLELLEDLIDVVPTNLDDLDETPSLEEGDD